MESTPSSGSRPSSFFSSTNPSSAIRSDSCSASSVVPLLTVALSLNAMPISVDIGISTMRLTTTTIERIAPNNALPRTRPRSGLPIQWAPTATATEITSSMSKATRYHLQVCRTPMTSSMLMPTILSPLLRRIRRQRRTAVPMGSVRGDPCGYRDRSAVGASTAESCSRCGTNAPFCHVMGKFCTRDRAQSGRGTVKTIRCQCRIMRRVRRVTMVRRRARTDGRHSRTRRRPA